MRKRKGIRVCTKLMRSIKERIARRGDEGATRGSWSREEGSGRRRRDGRGAAGDVGRRRWMTQIHG